MTRFVHSEARIVLRIDIWRGYYLLVFAGLLVFWEWALNSLHQITVAGRVLSCLWLNLYLVQHILVWGLALGVGDLRTREHRGRHVRLCLIWVVHGGGVETDALLTHACTCWLNFDASAKGLVQSIWQYMLTWWAHSSLPLVTVGCLAMEFAVSIVLHDLPLACHSAGILWCARMHLHGSHVQTSSWRHHLAHYGHILTILTHIWTPVHQFSHKTHQIRVTQEIFLAHLLLHMIQKTHLVSLLRIGWFWIIRTPRLELLQLSICWLWGWALVDLDLTRFNEILVNVLKLL